MINEQENWLVVVDGGQARIFKYVGDMRNYSKLCTYLILTPLPMNTGRINRGVRLNPLQYLRFL